MGIALGIAITISMAGAVGYFATQETNILTTQEGFGVVGPKLIKADDTNVISFSIKNTGTTPIEKIEVEVLGACEKSDGSENSDLTMTAKTPSPALKPGATYGSSEKVAGTCATSAHNVEIDAGKSYIVQITATATGTGSTLHDTFSVTSRY